MTTTNAQTDRWEHVMFAPRDGRPFPADARANDLIHWHTTLFTADLVRGADALRGARAVFVAGEVFLRARCTVDMPPKPSRPSRR